METVYIETTIVSYLMANPSRDSILAAHQQLTRRWWQDQRSACHCLVSGETLAEAARGDAEQSRLRLEALQGLPALPITAEVEALADAILQSGSLPPAARSDAIHVAAATLSGVDVLLTWNCRHLANPHLQKQLRAPMSARKFTLPEICTPIELGGQQRMNSNPILEEVWRIKDELAREANYDVHQLCENTRRWMAEHPHHGPVIHNAEELRQLIAEKERQRAAQTSMALNEEPPKPEMP